MIIAQNKKAFHEYFVEEQYEAGLVLCGWEVKSVRAHRVQLKEAYVVVRGAELWLLGAHIAPLPTVSTHVVPDATRTRKLLLQEKQIRRLIGAIARRGYTLVPVNIHTSEKGGYVKLQIGLARGKKQYDKRAAEKDKDWQREQQRLIRHAMV